MSNSPSTVTLLPTVIFTSSALAIDSIAKVIRTTCINTKNPTVTLGRVAGDRFADVSFIAPTAPASELGKSDYRAD